MATINPRTTAARSYGHWVAIIWPNDDHRQRGGYAIRVATGTLSRTGQMITTTDAAGRTLAFAPALDSSLSITRNYDTGSRSVSLSILVPLVDGLHPEELRFQDGRGVGEIAWLDENATGDGVVTWEERDQVAGFSGVVRGFQWGSRQERIVLTLAEEEEEDQGTFYQVGAELSGDRHVDILTDGDRKRAYRSDGALPPIPIAGTGSALWTPLYTVKDLVDAVPGATDLVAPRYLITYEPLADTSSSTRQARLVPNGRTEIDPRDESTYRGAAVEAQDLLGDTYAYMAGGFKVTFDSAASFTSGTAVVDARRRGRVDVGDVIKRTADGESYWEPVTSVDGDIEIDSNYAGTTGTSGQVIRLPADNATCFWLELEVGGGIRGVWSSSAMENPAEVIAWAGMRARLRRSIHFGDLRALATRLEAWKISTLILNNQARPWPWIQEKLLPFLPIRAYFEGSWLRFRWDGPVREDDIVATLDLDTPNGLYREPLLTTRNVPVYDSVELSYHYSWYRQRCLAKVTLLPITPNVAYGRMPTGRSLSTRDRYNLKTSQVYRAETYVTTDQTTASMMATRLLMQNCYQPQDLTVEGPPNWRWLRPGDAVRCTADNITLPSAVWRIESVTRKAGGWTRLDMTQAVV